MFNMFLNNLTLKTLTKIQVQENRIPNQKIKIKNGPIIRHQLLGLLKMLISERYKKFKMVVFSTTPSS